MNEGVGGNIRKKKKNKNSKQKNKLPGKYNVKGFLQRGNTYVHENNYQSHFQRKPFYKGTQPSDEGFFSFLFKHTVIVFLVLGFIYIVDYEKFVRIRDGASYYANKAVSFLPPELLADVKHGMEYFQPYRALALAKINVFMNETSTFLNTNPIVSEHWINFREISSIFCALWVTYLRTLYREASGFLMYLKQNFFNRMLW